MSDKDSQKTYRRRTLRWVIGASAAAALITIVDVAAAWSLQDRVPAWFISLTAASVVAWFAVGAGVVVLCSQRIAARATVELRKQTAALKRQMQVETARGIESLRAELHEDLDKAARVREAELWQEALRAMEEAGNVRKIHRG